MHENNGTELAMIQRDTGEIIEADVMPSFAVTLDESRRRIEQLQEFVRSQMVPGQDYGIIPGTGGKPTLYKPGAEKLNALFGLAPTVEVVKGIEQWDATPAFLYYMVKVTLINKRSQQVEAEGVGSCNSREKKYRGKDAADLANTILKIAKKRALIDATLSATRCSGSFTQDVEDLDLDHDTPRLAHSNGHPAPPPAGPLPACPKCGAAMWDNRERKTNPKAPDFKCKNKDGCDGVLWPGQWPPKPQEAEAAPVGATTNPDEARRKLAEVVTWMSGQGKCNPPELPGPDATDSDVAATMKAALAEIRRWVREDVLTDPGLSGKELPEAPKSTAFKPWREYAEALLALVPDPFEDDGE